MTCVVHRRRVIRRHELSDAEWQFVRSLLPDSSPERGPTDLVERVFGLPRCLDDERRHLGGKKIDTISSLAPYRMCGSDQPTEDGFTMHSSRRTSRSVDRFDPVACAVGRLEKCIGVG